MQAAFLLANNLKRSVPRCHVQGSKPADGGLSAEQLLRKLHVSKPTQHSCALALYKLYISHSALSLAAPQANDAGGSGAEQLPRKLHDSKLTQRSCVLIL